MSRKTYPMRIPRAALGIRAQNLRTLARKAWWARRWTAALESFRLGARLGRGRAYATNGQVTELVIDGPHVAATIVGSRPDPYRVNVDFAEPLPAARARIAARLQAEPMLLARLFADDFPLEIGEAFAAEGAELFPTPRAHAPDAAVQTRYFCSCPDWSKPCKHLAAVLFLLGEEVARRPALLLSLRGIDPREFVEDEDAEAPDVFAQTADVPPPPEAATGTPLLRRLGPVPFWRGFSRCSDSLEKIYSRVRADL